MIFAGNIFIKKYNLNILSKGGHLSASTPSKPNSNSRIIAGADVHNTSGLWKRRR